MPDDAPGSVTTDQITAIWTKLTAVFGFAKDDRNQARGVCAHIVGRDLTSTTHLSKTEASAILDELGSWEYQAEQESTRPRDYLLALIPSQDAEATGE